jgi:hypothetical protein
VQDYRLSKLAICERSENQENQQKRKKFKKKTQNPNNFCFLFFRAKAEQNNITEGKLSDDLALARVCLRADNGLPATFRTSRSDIGPDAGLDEPHVDVELDCHKGTENRSFCDVIRKTDEKDVVFRLWTQIRRDPHVIWGHMNLNSRWLRETCNVWQTLLNIVPVLTENNIVFQTTNRQPFRLRITSDADGVAAAECGDESKHIDLCLNFFATHLVSTKSQVLTLDFRVDSVILCLRCFLSCNKATNTEWWWDLDDCLWTRQ